MSDISLVIAVIGAVLSIASFWIGRQTAAKSEGKEEGGLAKDIEYIKTSIEKLEKGLNDDVKRLEGRIDELSKQMIEISGTSSKAYESSRMEHTRLNEHLERDHGQILVKQKRLFQDE